MIYITGCRDATSEMMIGKYSHNGNENDSIFIFKNNIYKQKKVSYTGEIFRNQGTYTFNTTRIVFHKYIFYHDGGPGMRGDWDSRIRLVDQEIRLIYSNEDDIYYFKP